jgi:hypothetical protein
LLDECLHASQFCRDRPLKRKFTTTKVHNAVFS